jgi:hypothetical protein
MNFKTIKLMFSCVMVQKSTVDLKEKVPPFPKIILGLSLKIILSFLNTWLSFLTCISF